MQVIRRSRIDANAYRGCFLDGIRLAAGRVQVEHDMQAGGDARKVDLSGQAGIQGIDQGLAPFTVGKTQAAQMAFEMTLGNEVGDCSLGQCGRAAIDQGKCAGERR